KYEHYALEEDEIWGVAAGGQPSCLASIAPGGCHPLGHCSGTAPMLVSAAVMAFRECGPSGTETTTLVRPGDPSSVAASVPQGAVPLSLAWPWLVGLAPGWADYESFPHETRPVLVERNVLTGAEPVRVVLEPGAGLEGAEKTLPVLAGV